ncbi:MAG TPA: inositol 2-dehydrogenase [Vitreimonas sp.]|uniref:inositol 2-dehydrogenase n=1 Tax=Vitreimonas sp. TaxID=3069702 RepID=UPI002D6B6EE2|nr:inositol 2-dehydrogenase [Vitreimonas sp.]HYD88819.1 inositol 2-dehydrogenase [Vitreimonas sp.]
MAVGKHAVALIGAGRMGQIHGPNAARHPALSLRYVVDAQSGAAKALAQQLGAEAAALGDALADPDIAGAIVASSTDMHLEHSLAMIDAGKAVLCEKPIDLDLEKAKAAAPAFKDARFVLGFNRRFDPHVVALREKLASGAIGALETLTLINHDPAPPPPAFIPRSGGLFKDFTIHDLDLASYLMGEPPAEIFAAASCLVDKAIGEAGDVDTARVLLRTGSGKLCVISNTRRSGYGYDQRIEAYGSRGMAATRNERVDTVEFWSEAGARASPIRPNFLDRYAASYAAEMDHFAEVVSGRARPQVGYEEGLAALAWAEACAKSARTNTVVKLRGA